MSDSNVIDVHRLMVLLNELHRAGQRKILIFMPYLQKPIFSIDLSQESRSDATSTVEFLMGLRDYQKFLDGLKLRVAQREIPDYGTLQALLLQSGIVEYPNFNQLLVLLYNLCKRDFHKGDRPVYMGLDTNLFRDLFYSANFHTLARIPDNKIGFSVSPNVKDELTFDRRKYKSSELRALSEACSEYYFKQALEDFFNQTCLHDRLCRLGFVELDKVKRIHWIELLPELDPRDQEPSPDLNIIKTYKLAAVERNVDILLLSRDDGFIGHAQGIPGVITFQVDRPVFKRGKYPVSKWRSLCQLIYLAAAVCGMIRIQSETNAYLLQGIWKGKKSVDWSQERIKIKPLAKKIGVFGNCRKAWQVLDNLSWRALP